MTLSEQLRHRARIRIADTVLKYMTDAAVAGYPDEICGILATYENPNEGNSLEDDESAGDIFETITGIYPVQNESVTGSRRDHFYIDPLKLCQIEQKISEDGCRISGFFHSHPDAEAVLSKEDSGFMIPGMVTVIIPLNEYDAGKPRAYIRPDADEEIRELDIDIKEMT